MIDKSSERQELDKVNVVIDLLEKLRPFLGAITFSSRTAGVEVLPKKKGDYLKMIKI